MKGNIIVVGAGKLGSAIAKEASKLDRNVLVLDRKADVVDNLENFSGYIEQGDALDLDILEECGIKDADSVVITTDNDNTNIYLADVCQRIYHVNHIYVRLNDSRKAKICKGPNIKTICPFELSMADFMKEYEG
ncbi:MAG: NAD-binding protein [Erysipelotrichaceae bacterium]|nr:NAD-binding protein [Erysipelotrichaceae bacterium]